MTIMIAAKSGLPRHAGRRWKVRKAVTTADSAHPIVSESPHLWKPLVPDFPAPKPPQDGTIRPSGGGWYEVVIGGEVRDKVRGEAAAKARVEELAGVQSWDHVAG